MEWSSVAWRCIFFAACCLLVLLFVLCLKVHVPFETKSERTHKHNRPGGSILGHLTDQYLSDFTIEAIADTLKKLLSSAAPLFSTDVYDEVLQAQERLAEAQRIGAFQNVVSKVRVPSPVASRPVPSVSPCEPFVFSLLGFVFHPFSSVPFRY